jgi:hypothetical protein
MSDLADLVRSHMGSWLKARLTGCVFAARPEVWQQFYPVVPLDADVDVDALHDGIRVAAESASVAILIFPAIKDEAGLADLLRRMATHGRWSCSEFTDREGLEDHELAIDLRWKKDSGELDSSIMGFAPFASMPLTRRAPFVAMALWPCGHDNKDRKKPDPRCIGVGDMHHDVETDTYKKWFRSTLDTMAQFRTLPGIASAKTGETFRLPTSLRGQVGI